MKKQKLLIIEDETSVALGADDFCAKPIDIKMLRVVLDRIFKMHGLETANRRLQEQASEGRALCGMIGISAAMQKIFTSD